MTRIVINSCFGGFSLSEKARAEYEQLSGKKISTYGWFVKEDDKYDGDIPRDDPTLVTVVEALGAGANGTYADLRIINVPDDVEWEIDAYDGNEQVAEKHRTWS